MRDTLLRLAAVAAGGYRRELAKPVFGDFTTVGVAGLLGIAERGDWEAVAAADAPALPGDEVSFVALADGTLVVDQDVPEGSLGPLADELEQRLRPPYRAVAVRQHESRWAVAAEAVALVELDAREANVIEFAWVGSEYSCTIDGEPSRERFLALDRFGEGQDGDYALRAERIETHTWVVDVWPL